MPTTFIQDVLATAWGKLLAVLTIATLAGGLVTEGVTIWSGTSEARIARSTADYTAAKQKADADLVAFNAAIAQQKTLNAKLRESAKADEANYNAELQHQVARNAEIRKQAEADLKRAEADLNAATSVYAQRQAAADATKVESELAKAKAKRDILKLQVVKCYRPCADPPENMAICVYGCMTDLASSVAPP